VGVKGTEDKLRDTWLCRYQHVQKIEKDHYRSRLGWEKESRDTSSKMEIVKKDMVLRGLKKENVQNQNTW